MKLRPSYVSAVIACALGAPLGFAQIPYPGNDADHGVTRVMGAFDPYTGNMAFATRDIVVAGAVGRHGLSWSRHATSRTSQTENLFGLAHNWAHGWQWEMVDAGKDTQGRSVISVREPQGWVHRFTETSPGEWWPAPGVQDRVVSKGNSFVVNRLDAGVVRFTRQSSKQGDTFQLDAMIDPEGNASAFVWQGERLAQVTEPAGRWLKISYGTLTAPKAAVGAPSFTVITSVTASDSQVVGYTYEFLANTDYPSLTSVVYPDGTTARYTYAVAKANGRLLLSSADDSKGDRALRGRIFAYRTENEAAQGQVADVKTKVEGSTMQNLAADTKAMRSYAITQTNGAIVYQTFAPGGNMIEEIDALGFAKKRGYDAADRGFLTSTTDAFGHTTSFQNDASGHMVKTTFVDGASRATDRDPLGRVLAETNELGNTHRYFRDAKGRISIHQLPDGSKETIAYNDLGQILVHTDPVGAVSKNEYDIRGLRLKTTNALGATVAFTYDARDWLVATTDPHGNIIRYNRDMTGRVTKTIFADGVGPQTFYNTFGQVVKNIDASGSAHTMVYDVFGRRTSTFDASGGEVRFEYSVVGDGKAPMDRPINITSPSGRTITLEYDRLGRLTARTNAAGTQETATSRTSYDAIGRRASVTDERGKTIKFSYDQRGRRTKIQSALNHGVSVEYDLAGRKITETDAKGNITRWTYDTMGRETTKTDALNNVTRRAYDSRGSLATLTDAKGNSYRFEYDAVGHQTALIYPDQSRETTEFDAVGLKIRHTNRAGANQTFLYDNRNREISSLWSDGSQKITKTYDAAGRMTREHTDVSDISYEYDLGGRLKSETQNLSSSIAGTIRDPASKTIHYGYTPDGQKDSLTYPDGTIIRYAYNERGQIQDILGEGVPPIASYDYDSAGNATKMPRENDTETFRSYDDENKVSLISETGPRRSPLSQLSYEYDDVGNRTASMMTIGTGATSQDAYIYDPTYQVTGIDYGIPIYGRKLGTPASSERFSYDQVGSMTKSSENGVSTLYATNSLNQYTRVNNLIPAYDRNGNLYQLGDWTYNYDAMNRLTEARSSTMLARFYYDAKNRCVARSFNGVLTLRYYDNWNLIEECDANGGQLARYVYGRRIDEVVSIINRFGTFYPHYDLIGNITMLTNSAGEATERYSYSLNGRTVIFDGKNTRLDKSLIGNRSMFTGREFLTEIGLYDFRNRLYSPQLSRFIQVDPIRFEAGDVNIYRYCGNGFLQRIDPMGLADINIVYINTGDISLDNDSKNWLHDMTSRLNSADPDNTYTFWAVYGINGADAIASSGNQTYVGTHGVTNPDGSYSHYIGTHDDGFVPDQALDGDFGDSSFHCGKDGVDKVSVLDVENKIMADQNVGFWGHVIDGIERIFDAIGGFFGE